MLKTITERRLEILDWEENNRTLKNRAVEEVMSCRYYLKGTPGCAIGRLLPEELAKGLSGTIKLVFEKLPKDIQELGYDFLHDIQLFHDYCGNFTETGLSESGVKHMQLLEEKWKDEKH